jgi:hypothetical protein
MKVQEKLQSCRTLLQRSCVVIGVIECMWFVYCRAEMTEMSSTLAAESKSYASRAKDLHRQVGAETHATRMGDTAWV